jgi:hypothetical protein
MADPAKSTTRTLLIDDNDCVFQVRGDGVVVVTVPTADGGTRADSANFLGRISDGLTAGERTTLVSLLKQCARAIVSGKGYA